MLKFVCNGKCVLLCSFCSYFNGDHMISLFFFVSILALALGEMMDLLFL